MNIIIDELIAVMMSYIARLGMRDAFEYKKSKTRLKKEYKQYSFWRHITKIYPPGDSFAPKHMKAFLIFRITNLIIMIFIFVFSLIAQKHGALQHVLSVIVTIKMIMIYGPFFVYILFLAVNSSGKQVSFDIFKKP